MATRLPDLTLVKMVVIMWLSIAKKAVKSSDPPSLPLVKMAVVTWYKAWKNHTVFSAVLRTLNIYK